MLKKCKKHGMTKFCGKRPRCCKCMVEAVGKNRRSIKRKSVDYKGGKCGRCGYDKCIAALDFHHLDPNKKDFIIGSGNNQGWDKIKAELDKCILLCANCHREIHNSKSAVGETGITSDC